MQHVSRRTISLLATALAVLGLSVSSAQAKVLRVTGEKTTITPSAQVTHFLAAHHITVTAVGAATIAGGSLTLPISGGFVSMPKLNGVLFQRGGVKFTAGTHSVVLRFFVIDRIAGRTFVSAKVGAHRLTVARVTNASVSITGKHAVATGELRLSATAAHAINLLFGKKVVSAGADLGTVTSNVTVT